MLKNFGVDMRQNQVRAQLEILYFFLDGVFQQIVWVCSPWSSQISPGTYVFHVGCQKDIERVRLTCPEPYFASEGVLCRREQLSEDTSKEVKLLVVR